MKHALQVAALGLIALASCHSTPQVLDEARALELRDAATRGTWMQLNAEGRGLQLKGEATFLNRTETFEFLLAGDGRYRRFVSGPLGQLEVFDGTRVVRQDSSGLTRELDLGDRAEAPLLASILTGVWADSQDLRVRESAPGHLVVDRPGTPLEFELDLNEAGNVPAQITEETSSGESIMQLLGWTTIEGLAVPMQIEVRDQADGEDSLGESYTAVEGHVVKLHDSSFTIDETPPTDFAFDASLDAHVEARRAITGHVLVHPTVAGEDLGWFILDSGAGAMVLDRTAARGLELEPLGEVRAVGVGGSETTQFVRGAALQLGPMAFDVPVFVELDLAFLSGVFGVPIGGIIGYDFFGRAVVEIDTETVALHDARTFTPDAAWPSVALAFQGKTPCAEASFPAQGKKATAWFRLDTGANGALTFHAPAVKSFDLLANRETHLAEFGGVGGTSSGYFGQLEWFELGGRRMEALEAGFAMNEVGTFADAYTAGNIGQEVFKGARLVFDFPAERLYFAPSLDAETAE